MIAARLERLLGAPPRHVRDLGTSHDWTVHKAVLADGRAVFVKATRGAATGRAPHAGVFAAEAAGLAWLAAPGVAAVPEVVAADEATLVLPWLEEEEGTIPAAAERFGRELAALHAAGPDSFGADWPGSIARLPLDNTAASAWPQWYAERRLLPYVRMAADAGELTGTDVRLFERAAEAIPAAAGPAAGERPARIHGDLWSGNILWSGGRGWLIDPAAHGGHRETDLAMLALFGAPHLDRIRGAYNEAFPLRDGWRERIPLHQLHPLLVHVVLFGGGYRAAAVDAARAVLGLA